MAKIVKPAGQWASGLRPKMHGSTAERVLAGGTGALIRQNATRVPVTGDKPGGRQRGKP